MNCESPMQDPLQGSDIDIADIYIYLQQWPKPVQQYSGICKEFYCLLGYPLYEDVPNKPVEPIHCQALGADLGCTWLRPGGLAVDACTRIRSEFIWIPIFFKVAGLAA